MGRKELESTDAAVALEFQELGRDLIQAAWSVVGLRESPTYVVPRACGLQQMLHVDIVEHMLAASRAIRKAYSRLKAWKTRLQRPTDHSRQVNYGPRQVWLAE